MVTSTGFLVRWLKFGDNSNSYAISQSCLLDINQIGCIGPLETSAYRSGGKNKKVQTFFVIVQGNKLDIQSVWVDNGTQNVIENGVQWSEHTFRQIYDALVAAKLRFCNGAYSADNQT